MTELWQAINIILIIFMGYLLYLAVKMDKYEGEETVKLVLMGAGVFAFICGSEFLRWMVYG